MTSSGNPRKDLIDPDPFSAFLIALGAVGSVASIASWIEQKRDKRKQAQERLAGREDRYRLSKALVDLRSNLTELQGAVDKLNLFLRLRQHSQINEEPGLVPSTLQDAPAKFGGLYMNLTDRDLKELSALHGELASLAKHTGEKTFRILAELEDQRVWVSAETAAALRELRNVLNGALSAENYVQLGERCRQASKLGADAIDRLIKDTQG